MLQAILRGKLSREQENMEDVLTSNVFGLLRYVPPHEGLLPLLSRAESVDESFPLAPRLADDEIEVRTDDYEFWPRWTNCEPDVVIRIRPPSGRQLLVLVEAKYKSGKSSKADEENEDPSDQLAREWGNLVRVAGEDAEPFLIYLTASIGFPKSDIEASIREYRQKRPMDSGPPQILALSWRQVPELFRGSANPILRDLCALSDRLRLRYFHGVHAPAGHQKWSWRYNPLPARWTRQSEATAIKWRFRR